MASSANTFDRPERVGAPDDNPGFTADLDESIGVLTITAPDDFVLEAGWTLTGEKLGAVEVALSLRNASEHRRASRI